MKPQDRDDARYFKERPERAYRLRMPYDGERGPMVAVRASQGDFERVEGVKLAIDTPENAQEAFEAVNVG